MFAAYAASRAPPIRPNLSGASCRYLYHRGTTEAQSQHAEVVWRSTPKALPSAGQLDTQQSSKACLLRLYICAEVLSIKAQVRLL